MTFSPLFWHVTWERMRKSVRNLQYARELSDFNVSVHGPWLSCPDLPLELGTAVVFRLGSLVSSEASRLNFFVLLVWMFRIWTCPFKSGRPGGGEEMGEWVTECEKDGQRGISTFTHILKVFSNVTLCVIQVSERKSGSLGVFMQSASPLLQIH